MVAFSEWYEKNKDAHNARRRERYRENEDLRAKARERARKHRQENAGKEPAEARTRKEGNRTLYPLRLVAKKINRHPQSVRRWESIGYIPDVRETGGSRHRHYTWNQVRLIMKLGKFIDSHGGQVIEEDALQATITEIREKWEA